MGLGNVLMGDDAFGPYVVRTLEARYEFPEGVEVVDLGTPGLDLYPHLSGAAALIVVDTVRSEGPAGAMRRYRVDELMRHAPGPRLSPHDPGLKETLMTMKFSGEDPADFLLVGTIPGTTAQGTALSPAVQSAVAEAEAAVVAELRRLGKPPVLRPNPCSPDIWWERP